MSLPPDYGCPAFVSWRSANQASWDLYTRHSFVEGLRSGELPEQAFINYLIQDYLFLMHFARAWSLVVVKAGSIAEMRLAAATVDALVNQEMQLHVRTCERYGISETELENAQEMATNTAYTRYVLATGQSGDLLDLLAALAPCVFGYGEIGVRLGRDTVADNPYQSWINTYADDAYQKVCRDVGGLIETVVARRLGVHACDSPRWSELTAIFAQATRLEAEFWSLGRDVSG